MGRLAFRIGRLDPLINLSPVNGNVLRSFNAESYLVATDFDHNHDDIFADDYALARFSGQYQHGKSSLVSHQFRCTLPLVYKECPLPHVVFLEFAAILLPNGGFSNGYSG